MSLPLTYSLRNLTRRPMRTLLTMLGIAIVIFAAVVMAALSRGVQARLQVTGEDQNLLMISRNGQNIMFSSIEASEVVNLNALPGLALNAAGEGLLSTEIIDMAPVSAEYAGKAYRGPINVRGVLPVAYPVHTVVKLTEGRLPESADELIAGCAAHVRMLAPTETFAVGRKVRIYNRDWTIVGRFTANGTLFESELWADMEQLKTLLRRQTCSFVVARMEDVGKVKEALPLFSQTGAFEKYFKGWPEPQYYQEYLKSLSWVYWLSLVMAATVTIAGVLIGVNTMYTAILNRIREIATQRVLGFARSDILRGLLLESVLMALAGGLLGVAAGQLLNDWQFKFSQGVFQLRVDALVSTAGCVQAVLIGLLGALFPAYKGLRLTIVDALRYGRGA